MQKTISSKKKNDNTFNQLLDWLDSDHLKAGNKYQEIHHKLILYFAARGCAEAEDLADVTIDRVTSKICNENLEYKGNKTKYFYGFAKNIHLEYQRERSFQLNEEILGDDNSVEIGIEEDEISESELCLKKCLDKLKNVDKKLMLEYYSAESGREKEFREKIAKKYKLSSNLLRVKVFRLKNNIANCIETCLNA